RGALRRQPVPAEPRRGPRPLRRPAPRDRARAGRPPAGTGPARHPGCRAPLRVVGLAAPDRAGGRGPAPPERPPPPPPGRADRPLAVRPRVLQLLRVRRRGDGGGRPRAPARLAPPRVRLAGLRPAAGLRAGGVPPGVPDRGRDRLRLPRAAARGPGPVAPG